MLSVLVGGCNQIPSAAHHKSAALHLIRKVIVFHATESLRLVTSSVGHMDRAKPSAVLCSSAVQSRFDLAALVLLFGVFTKTGNPCLFSGVNKIRLQLPPGSPQRRLIASLFSNHTVRPTCSHNTLWAACVCVRVRVVLHSDLDIFTQMKLPEHLLPAATTPPFPLLTSCSLIRRPRLNSDRVPPSCDTSALIAATSASAAVAARLSSPLVKLGLTSLPLRRRASVFFSGCCWRRWNVKKTKKNKTIVGRLLLVHLRSPAERRF